MAEARDTGHAGATTMIAPHEPPPGALDAMHAILRVNDLSEFTFGSLRIALADRLGAPVPRGWLKSAIATEAIPVNGPPVSEFRRSCRKPYTQARMDRDHFVLSSLYQDTARQRRRDITSSAQPSDLNALVTTALLQRALAALPRRRGTLAAVCRAVAQLQPELGSVEELRDAVKRVLRSQRDSFRKSRSAENGRLLYRSRRHTAHGA